MYAGHVVKMRPHLVHPRDVQALKGFIKLLIRVGDFFDTPFEHALPPGLSALSYWNLRREGERRLPQEGAGRWDVCTCTTHTPARISAMPAISTAPTGSLRTRPESATAATGVRLPSTDAREGPMPFTPKSQACCAMAVANKTK